MGKHHTLNALRPAVITYPSDFPVSSVEYARMRLSGSRTQQEKRERPHKKKGESCHQTIRVILVQSFSRFLSARGFVDLTQSTALGCFRSVAALCKQLGDTASKGNVSRDWFELLHIVPAAVNECSRLMSA